MSPSFVLPAQDLSQAFSRALGDSLPQILAAVQNQTSHLSAWSVTASRNMPSNTCASSFPNNSPPGFVAGPSAGNVIVPSFVSTYCTLGNSSLSHPSLFGSHGFASGALPATSQFFSPAFFLLPPWLTRLLLCYTNLLPSAQDNLLFRRSWLQNKGRAIHRSGGPATRKRQGPGFRAPNVPGWETTRVY